VSTGEAEGALWAVRLPAAECSAGGRIELGVAREERYRGRGAGSNPPNRFERLAYEPDPYAEAWADPWEADDSPEGAGDASGGAASQPVGGPRSVPTQYFRDATRTIIARNQSPDIGYDASINPYRGCTHGWLYNHLLYIW
jgi:hypothetical protein